MEPFIIGPYFLSKDPFADANGDVYADYEEERDLAWGARFHGLCAKGIMRILGVDLPEQFQFVLHEKEVTDSFKIEVRRDLVGNTLYVPKTGLEYFYGERDIPLSEGNYWLVIEDLT